MKHEFQNLQDALACLRENYPFVVLGETTPPNLIRYKIEPVLGEDAFSSGLTVTTSLRWGWMWLPAPYRGNQFIVAFEDANAFVLARLAGAFDGIKIEEFK